MIHLVSALLARTSSGRCIVSDEAESANIQPTQFNSIVPVEILPVSPIEDSLRHSCATVSHRYIFEYT